MRKTLLSFFLALTTIISANAQSFEWGTASWNIEDGKVYESIDELNAEGVVLTYPNPANYALTFLNVITVSYDLFVDGADEPLNEMASAQMGTAVKIGYNFVEGHSYKIVTKGAALAQANLATYTTDTLSTNSDSYTISFSINGPELVKTIDVEESMSLSILDQEWQKTVSLIDVPSICEALGIASISEAQIYGLNGNGSYCPEHNSYFDGWRDADGEYTLWTGGYNSIAGHNAYPAVYSIKITEDADSIVYYFYDYWKEYVPEGNDEIDNITTRAPQTSYNNILWDWEKEDGSIIKYTRFYRCDEGKTYPASFAVVANKKYVLINAYMHFLSQEDYAAYLATKNAKSYDGTLVAGIAMPQDPATPLMKNAPEAQSVTISAGDDDEHVNISFSGFTMPLMNRPTGEVALTNVEKKILEDGTVSYTLNDASVNLGSESMIMIYKASLTGTQAADAVPQFTLTLSQASILTATFGATADDANASLDAAYKAASVNDVKATEVPTAVYSISGVQQKSTTRGINLIKYADGTVKKVLK